MTAQKPPSTALARILVLSLAGGSLAACDYASKLPEAPATLGYEIESRKPPSVTAEPAAVPPPVDGYADAALQPPPPLPAPAPVVAPQREFAAVNTDALAPPPLPEYRAAVPQRQSPELIAPLEPVVTGDARIGTVSAPIGDSFAYAERNAPRIGDGPLEGGTFETYEPVAFDSEQSGSYVGVGSVDSLGDAPVQSYEVAAAPISSVPETITGIGYQPAPEYTTPPLATPLPFESGSPIYRGEGGFEETGMSPLAVLSTRLSNGAVVNVHPVIGAPAAVSKTLARAIANEIGTRVTSATGAGSPVFDLRATAEPGSPARASWNLYNSSGVLVGTFRESQGGGDWASLDPAAVNAVGRRVADRLRRNDNLRSVSLSALDPAPQFVSMYADPIRTQMIGKAPAAAPLPPRHPSRMAPAPLPAPVEVAMLAPPSAPLTIVPPRRPETRPAPQILARPAPIDIAPLAAPLETQPYMAPAPTPQFAPAPAQPLAPLTVETLPAAPEPSFDTLRPAQPAPNQQVASIDPVSGPPSVVFQGVTGAPGDGDTSLSREVARLLAQSGAKLSQTATSDSLFLTASVTKTRSGSADRIKIVWQVQNAAGERIGQVVQENDVPSGALDGGWGQDAFYAAQGARDGIMQLLREAGALQG